jgi:hypothetical protein
MPLPQLRRDYARWRALYQLMVYVTDSYEAVTDQVVRDHFGGDPEAFVTAQRVGLDVEVPTSEHMHELIDLITRTSAADYTLGYKDREYLGLVRSSLIDALNACLVGDIEGVAGHTNEAWKQLHFITYERKRTDKRDYHNPFSNERGRFERLTARASKLARQLDRVVVMS